MNCANLTKSVTVCSPTSHHYIYQTLFSYVTSRHVFFFVLYTLNLFEWSIATFLVYRHIYIYLINSLSSFKDKDFNLLHSVHQWHIFFIVSHHDISFLNNAFYKLEKTKFLCLSSNLSYPEDLKKQWFPFSILSLLPFLIYPSLSSIPSCSSY